MSSIILFGWPSFNSSRYLTVFMISTFVSTVLSSGSSSPNFSLIFNLPTFERLKRSPLKKKFCSIICAASRVGGSPGFIFLYSSISACSGEVILSSVKVSRRAEPVFCWPICNNSTSFIPFSTRVVSSSAVKGVLHGTNISSLSAL